MGASLAGALKTTSLTAISREAYDEATNPAVPEAKVEAAGGGDKEARAGEGAKASRPGMLGASKRGSFVGVVGGLETGAYGGLAAVSRHLVGIPGTSTSSDDKNS
jgi:actin-related protein 10